MLVQVVFLSFIALFIGISTSAGIGGGTLINLLLIGGFDYTTKESIIVAYLFLMGGGLAATLVSARKLNSKGKRLIDYDLVLLTLPMMISGSILGTILNHFISQKLVTIIFIGLMVHLIKFTYNQMRDTRRSSIDSGMQSEIIEVREEEVFRTRLGQLLEEQKKAFPQQKIRIIVQIYIYTVVVVLIRGGQGYTSIIGLQQCNIGSWVMVILHIILSYLYSKSIAIRQFQRDLQKQSLGYVFSNSREKMSEKKLKSNMFNGFLAGVLAASVGVSGGIILVPLWLRSGVDRDIVINSTAPLLFISSSVSFLISVLFHFYDSLMEIVLFFFLSFLATYYIKNRILYWVEKYQMKRLQYGLLFVVMLISMVAFIPTQYYKSRKDHILFEQFGQFC